MTAAIRRASVAGILLLAALPAGCRPGDKAPAAADSKEYRQHFQAARQGFDSGDWAAAEAELLRAIGLWPDSVEAHFLLGKTYFAENFYRQAEGEFDAVVDLDPETIDGRLGLIRIFLKEGRRQEIDDRVEEILRRAPDHPEGLFFRGLQASRRGEYTAAIDDFQRVLQQAPGHIEARYHLGLAWMKSGRFEEAVVALRQTLVRDPGHLGAHQHLAGTLRRMGLPEAAARAGEAYRNFREAGKRNQDSLKYRELAVQAYNSEKFPEALAAFREIVAVAPEDSQAVAYLGSAHLALGNRPEAFRFLEQALRLDPRNAFAQLEMGRYLALEGDLQGAESSFLRAIDINAEFSLPHYFLAGLYRSLNRIAESDREFAEFQRLEKRSSESSLPDQKEYW